MTAAPPAPTSTARLTAGWLRDRSLTWEEHQRQHGPLPTVGPDLIRQVEASGLLGRGGAGFPAGRKLRTVASGGRRAVVVVNAAESEPAAGKDQLLLAHAPHLVIDGALLAAAAVRTRKIHLCLHRGSAALPAVVAAVRERRDTGRIRVHELPRRYVAGEESALVHWLNGGTAQPTFVPPRPFERGVDGRPTLVQNAETMAHIALIGRHGAAWYRSVGAVDEPGTLLVSLRGAVAAPGIYEVDCGLPVGALFERAGGAQPLQAVLVGGYFGSWLPAPDALATPLSHAGMRTAGGALGAGIVVALPATACGVTETARVATYLAKQSAGQCGPCLNGLPNIAQVMTDLAHGRWSRMASSGLTRWLDVVPGRGACRHPDGAVQFVASALRTFRADVAAHASGRPCRHTSTAPVLPVPPTDGSWR